MTKNKIGLVVALSMILQIFVPTFYQLVEASGLPSFDPFITRVEIRKNKEGGELLAKMEQLYGNDKGEVGNLNQEESQEEKVIEESKEDKAEDQTSNKPMELIAPVEEEAIESKKTEDMDSVSSTGLEETGLSEDSKEVDSEKGDEARDDNKEPREQDQVEEPGENDKGETENLSQEQSQEEESNEDRKEDKIEDKEVENEEVKIDEVHIKDKIDEVHIKDKIDISENTQEKIEKNIKTNTTNRMAGEDSTLDKIVINREDSIFIDYNFAIDDGELKELNHKYKLELPKGILPEGIENKNEPLGDVGFIEIVGFESLPEKRLSFRASLVSGEIIISFGDSQDEFNKFKDEIKALLEANPSSKILKESVTGNFGFAYSFTEKQKKKDCVEIGPFVADGSIIAVEFEKEAEKPSGFKELKKNGKFNEMTKKIDWTVDLTGVKLKAGETISLTDEIGSGHAYVEDSMEIGGGKVTPKIEGNKLEFDLTGPIDGAVKIKYSTLINGLGENIKNSMVYENEVKASLNNIEKSADGKVDRKNLIAKTGEMTGPDGEKVIDWTVTINPEGLDLGDLEFEDEIGQGHELISASINAKKGEEQITVTNNLYENDQIKFDLVGVDKQVTIKYKTRLVDISSSDGYKIDAYRNTAYISQGDKKFRASAGIGHGVLLKSGKLVKEDGEGYYIDWTIEVNPYNEDIKGRVIDDTFENRQKLLLDTFKVNDSALEEHDKLSLKENGFTFTFREAIGNQDYTIKYRTKVIDKSIIGINTTEYRLVNGKWVHDADGAWYQDGNNNTKNNIAKNTVSLGGYSASASVPIKSQVISKRPVSYDYANREMTWEATINQNMMPIDGAVFTDILGPGQSFIEDRTILEGSASNLVKGLDYSLNIGKLENGNQEMTIKFLKQITDQYKISYTTKVDQAYLEDQNKNNENKYGITSLTNLATLIGEQIQTGGVKVDSSKAIKNTILTKEGSLDKSKISWQVNLNENHLNLGQVVLKDQLQEGLELDLSSVKLHNMDIDSNGKISLGEEVLGQLKTDYDNESREISFKFDSDLKTAYIIRFDTDIVGPASGGQFTNTIEFDGMSSEKYDYQSISIEFNESDWSSINGVGGIDGVIKLSKTDEAGRWLPGASFELLDSERNSLDPKREAVTDENGAIRFSDLEKGKTYFIKEVKAPAGYQLDPDYHKVEIGESGIANIIKSIKLENKKIVLPKPEPEETGGSSSGGGGGGSSSTSRPSKDKDKEKYEEDKKKEPVEDLDIEKPLVPEALIPEPKPEEEVDETLVKDLDQKNKADKAKKEKDDEYLNLDGRTPKGGIQLEDEYLDLDGKTPRGGLSLEDENRLPKTGDTSSLVFYALGLVFIGLGLGLTRKKKK